MLATIWGKVKEQKGLILDLGIALFSILVGFGLGRLSKIESYREPVRIIRATSAPAALVAASGGLSEDGEGVVASKSGTKYHYPWCSGAARISAANKITFSTITAARAKGYTPASNCPGLE